MLVNFSDLRRNAYGQIEQPMLILRRPHGAVLGILGHAFNLSLALKFSEVSEGSFVYPACADGADTSCYAQLVGDKIVEAEGIGSFIVSEVTEQSDGIRKVKEVSLRSLEYELRHRNIVLGAGTYNLWNPADPENTLLGIAFQDIRNWKIGYVSPTLIGRYRTFDDTEDKLNDFLWGTAQDSYGCLFVYDSNNRTLNVYDANDTVSMMPIYLSYQNLIKENKISENSEDVITRLSVHGAEGTDIREVNPLASNHIYNLDYYIETGDIEPALATKWLSWQNEVSTQQLPFMNATRQKAVAMTQLVTANARLTDLRNELSQIDTVLSSFVQMRKSVDRTQDDWNDTYDYFTDRIAEAQSDYDAKELEIETQEELIKDVEATIESYTQAQAAIRDSLSMKSYFTDSELNVLDYYFKDGTFEDSTFAVLELDISSGTTFMRLDGAKLALSDAVWAETECDGDHKLYTFSDGSKYFEIPADHMSKVMLSGTWEKQEYTEAAMAGVTDNVKDAVSLEYSIIGALKSGVIDSGESVLASLSLNECEVTIKTTTNDTIKSETQQFPTANFTIACGGMNVDATVLLESTVDADDGVATPDVCDVVMSLDGTSEASMTRGASEFQRYEVAQELYDYATLQHKDIAWPVYEFDIESGNIIYAEKFEPFKDALRLGAGCYLEMSSSLKLTPLLIEIHLDFDNPDNFSLIFSNQFRRPGDVNKLKEAIVEASSAASSFDSSKFAYSANNNTTTFLRQWILDGYDAALAQIRAGANNTVTIDQLGVTIASTDNSDVIRLNNGMIALHDKAANEVKLAMGHFKTPSGNEYYGILADVIAGTLLAGENLIIECPDPNGGVMQFKVDSSGVILNNGRFYIRNDIGAMGMDAKHGFFAGTKELFVMTDSGYVIPVCINEGGSLILDDDGFPKDTNVWIGIDGQVYIRGNIYAESGHFNGVVQATDFLDASGKSMLTDSGKISSEYLELMGLVIKNSAGETVLEITEDGIYFISSNDGSGDAASDYEDRIADLEDTVGGWRHNGGTYIDGGMIKAGTVMASSLQGGEVLLLDEDENDAGYITIEDASSSDYAIRLGSGGALSMVAEGGNVYIDSMGNFIGVDGADTGDVTTNTNIRSTSDGTYDLGLSWARWGDVYASNGTIQTSDAEKKTDFQYDLSNMDGFFNALKPLRYKFKDGHGRYHIGYISQDIEAALTENSLDSMDFAGFIKSEKPDGDGYDYALRYSEFIALNTWQIQQMKARIEELEAKLAALTNN